MATKNVILKDSSSNELRPETVLTQVKDASGNDLFTQTSGVISTTTGNSINGASINDASIGSAKFIKSELVNLIYPVGAIYMSTVNTSPATLFGGTWIQILDQFLLSAGNTYTAGTTGGSATHNHTLENGAALMSPRSSGGGYAYAKKKTVSDWMPNADCEEGDVYRDFSQWTITSGVALGGTTDNASSLPPYFVVYMWRRTA